VPPEAAATKFAESIPSLKNLRPNPGDNGIRFSDGYAADENLMIP